MTVKRMMYGGHALGITVLTFLLLVGVAGAITNDGVEKLIDINGDYDPSYSPEGSKIVFSVGDPIPNSGSIQVLDLNSKEVGKINMPGGSYMYTDWSPLGDSIVFVSYNGGVGEICTINLDGSNKNCLTNDQGFDVGGPRFSPDGSKIAYFSHIHDSEDIGDIWLMDVNGNNKIQLTNDREYQTTPAFSPDGNKITYASGVWPNTHIWVMNADGTGNTQLTFDPVLEGEPSWSPDGRYIAYQRSNCRDYCSWNIWVMNSDGTEQTQLTNNGVDGAQPNWRPDGRKIAFVSHGFNNNINWDIYEMTLGGIDNTPPNIDCGSADGLWHGNDVSIACSASDSDSDLADSGDASFSLTTSVASGTEDSNAATGTKNICDNAGNCATAGPISGNKVDKKAPGITIDVPNTNPYTLNQDVAASYSCSDGGSGADNCIGTVISGSNIDTSTVGSKNFIVTATDKVGNTATSTKSYGVQYATGTCNGDAGHQILQPINAAGDSVFKQKSTVPAKFRVCDANGDSIGTPGLVTSFRLIKTVKGTVEATVNEPVDSTTPDTEFRWDPTSMQWIFNMNTKNQAATTTYYYSIILKDGTSILFNFGLK